jgi:hypothetical protein
MLHVLVGAIVLHVVMSPVNTGLLFTTLLIVKGSVPQLVIASVLGEETAPSIDEKYKELVEKQADVFGCDNEIFVAKACC